MEGMPVAMLAAKKKGLVQELNGFIVQKKAVSEQAESMSELVGTSGGRKGAAAPKTKESRILPPYAHASYDSLVLNSHLAGKERGAERKWSLPPPPLPRARPAHCISWQMGVLVYVWPQAGRLRIPG